MARLRPTARVVPLLVATLAAAAVWVDVRPDDSQPPELLEVNRRWEGALCRLRFPVEMRKGTNSDGFASSVALSYSRPGEKSMLLRLFVKGREVIRNGRVPAGTAFLSKGFRLRDPKKKKGLQLDLSLLDSGAGAHFLFAGQAAWTLKGFKLKNLDEIERVLRLNVCHLQSADERLVERPVATPPASPPPRSIERSTPQPEVERVFDPQVHVLAAAASPARVDRGQSVDLLVTYRIEGIPPGAAFEVIEQRRVLFDGRVRKTMEERVSREAGDYTSTQSLRVPSSAPTGVYELAVTVSIAGVEASGSALFEVR